MAGAVASLHVHPGTVGQPLIEIEEFNLVAEKGIREDPRYFGRVNNGKPARRQVTLIEREVIQRHAATLGAADLEPGDVRSNIETTGLDLVSLIGKAINVGE